MAGFDYRFTKPTAGPVEAGAGALDPRRSVEGPMLIERDVAIEMRDGVRIYGDLFRPAAETAPVPALVAWAPYGKHSPTKYEYFPGCGVSTSDLCPHAVFEGPEPSWWVGRGYAVLNVDSRGTWSSEGVATFISPEEAQDFYDTVEWAGTQPWCNGKVGTTGVSYLAIAQWRVAELHPPHLAAINPWEGWTDTYREVVRHGGIPETWFWPFIQGFLKVSTTEVEDLLAETAEHPFFDSFWESKSARPEQVTVPAFVVASWTDQGMHLRGTVDSFRRLASPEKWLDVHGRMKWAYYYSLESKARLQAFFDHFLKGLDTEVTSWPRVRVEARERHFEGRLLAGDDWPLPRTEYKRLYLDASGGAGPGALCHEPPAEEGEVTYHSLGGGPGPHRASFRHRFEAPVDLVGNAAAHLVMSADETEDLDVFVAVWKLDAEDKPVDFPLYQMRHDGPVALGWLRASHRELDPEASSEARPVHPHRREQPVTRGEAVALDIEIWPSGTHFEAGEQLLLIVQGTDVNRYPHDQLYARHEDSVNSGMHHLRSGGADASYLVVPIVAG